MIDADTFSLVTRANVQLRKNRLGLPKGECGRFRSWRARHLTGACGADETTEVTLTDTEADQHHKRLLNLVRLAQQNDDCLAVAAACTDALQLQETNAHILKVEANQLVHIQLLADLARALRVLGRNPEALNAIDRALTYYREHPTLHTIKTANRVPQKALVTLLIHRAQLLCDLHRQDAAAEAYELALNLLEPDRTRYFSDQALCRKLNLLHEYADTLWRLERSDESIGIDQRQIDVYESNPKCHASTAARVLYGHALANYGAKLTAIGDVPGAQIGLERAAKFFESHKHLLTEQKAAHIYLSCLDNQARLFRELGRPFSSLEFANKAIDLFETNHGLADSIEATREFVLALEIKGEATHSLELGEDAASIFSRAIAIGSSRPGSVDSVLMCRLLVKSATILGDLGKNEEAQGIDIRIKALQQSAPELLTSKEGRVLHLFATVNRARLLLDICKYDDAISTCKVGLRWMRAQRDLRKDQQASVALSILMRVQVAALTRASPLRRPLSLASWRVAASLWLAQIAKSTSDNSLFGREQRLGFLLWYLGTTRNSAPAWPNAGAVGTQHSKWRTLGRDWSRRWIIRATRSLGIEASELLSELADGQGPWWPRCVEQLGKLLSEADEPLSVFYAPVSHTWLRRMSAERSGHTQDAERRQFYRFMQSYLGLAHAKGRVDLLPRILAVLHGRKLLEIVLADLEDVGADAGLSAEQVHMRQQLRRLRGEIEEIRIRLSGGSGGPSGDFFGPSMRALGGELSVEALQAANKIRIEQEQQDQGRLKQLMDELQDVLKRDPELGRITGVVQITPKILHDRLAPGEALVILAPQWTAEAVDEQGTITAYVLLAGVSGDGFAMSFPGLTEHSQRLLSVRTLPGLKDVGRGLALREGAFGATAGEPAKEAGLPEVKKDSSEYEALVRTHFWDRLRESLLGKEVSAETLDRISIWHVAITGPLFTLPWAESAPQGVDCIVHSALPFFLKPLDTMPAATPIALSAHAGEDSPDTIIPAVLLEAALLRRLWGREPDDARACVESDRRVGVAHFSCHGCHDEQDPVRSHLWLKNAQGNSHRWETRQVTRSRATPQTALLMACLAGRSSSDAEGDPMGLASALMLRNTRLVIGALVSVPDGAMAWFGVLLQWHIQQGLAARQALRQTQQAFREADWPADFVQFLEIHLHAAMTEALGELQRVLVETRCDSAQIRRIVERFIGGLIPNKGIGVTDYLIPSDTRRLHPAQALKTGDGLNAQLDPLAAQLTSGILQAFQSRDFSKYPDSYRQLPSFVRAFGG